MTNSLTVVAKVFSVLWARSGVTAAMRAASQLPGRGPTDVNVAPVPACYSKIPMMMMMTFIFLLQKCEQLLQKLLTFFQQKVSMYLPYFNTEILTSRLLTSLF